MIPLLRVDLRTDIDPHEFPSRTLWSEDHPNRPPNQTGRKLLMDAETLVVFVDDIDLISPSQWARVRISKPEAAPVEPPEPASFVAEEAVTNPAVRKRGKHGGKK